MDWQEINTTKVEEALAAAAPDLEGFRAVAAGFFKKFAKPPYNRRPNLGLRLPGESCVIAVRPSWSWTHKQLDCEKVLVECITDDKLLSITLKPGELPRYSQISLRYGDVALERLLQVVRSFVKEPKRAFTGGPRRAAPVASARSAWSSTSTSPGCEGDERKGMLSRTGLCPWAFAVSG